MSPDRVCLGAPQCQLSVEGILVDVRTGHARSCVLWIKLIIAAARLPTAFGLKYSLSNQIIRYRPEASFRHVAFSDGRVLC